jgi:hypothetical protein
MEPGNPSRLPIGSWCPARGMCSSQRPPPPSLRAQRSNLGTDASLPKTPRYRPSRLRRAQADAQDVARAAIAAPRRCHGSHEMMRSWRSPRLLRIALRCSAPHPKKERNLGGTPMPPSASALPSAMLGTCPSTGSGHAPQVRSMEPGNPSRLPIWSWCPARGMCSSQRPPPPSLRAQRSNPGTDGPSCKTLRVGLQRLDYTPRNTRARRIASPRLRAMARNDLGGLTGCRNACLSQTSYFMSTTVEPPSQIGRRERPSSCGGQEILPARFVGH